MRQPVIAGVAGGVGTTTLAAALHATDGGVFAGRSPADVLVCRDTVASLGGAHRAVTAAPGRPLLVVVPSTGERMPRPARARLEMVTPHAEVAHVPWVGRWREVTDPWAQAATVLTTAREQLDKPLRGYAQAMQQLRDTVQQRLQAEPPTVPAPPTAPAPPAAFGTHPEHA